MDRHEREGSQAKLADKYSLLPDEEVSAQTHSSILLALFLDISHHQCLQYMKVHRHAAVCIYCLLFMPLCGGLIAYKFPFRHGQSDQTNTTKTASLQKVVNEKETTIILLCSCSTVCNGILFVSRLCTFSAFCCYLIELYCIFLRFCFLYELCEKFFRASHGNWLLHRLCRSIDGRSV